MRIQDVIAIFCCLACGCAKVPLGRRVVSLSFHTDPIDHHAEEAVEQIEVVVPSGTLYRIRPLPDDWAATAREKPDGAASYTLSCAHASFARPDIHAFDGLLRFLVRQGGTIGGAHVRLWITRGPLAPGRVVDLAEEDVVLK